MYEMYENGIRFHNSIAKSYIILTGSGDIQEDVPNLDKFVIMRPDAQRDYCEAQKLSVQENK